MAGNDLSIKTGSIGESLKVAFPLIVAASGHSLKLFTDRIMLSNYHGLAMAAALTSGVVVFNLMTIWLGSAGYVNAFVSQYTGAGRNDRVGQAVWQGIFIALIGGAVMASGWFWGEHLFRALNHAPKQLEYEISYFRVLCPGQVFFLINCALIGFWSGRGKTWVVALLELISTSVNLIANFFLIFEDPCAQMLGIQGTGLPGAGLGITGAAIGTVLAGFCSMTMGLILFLSPENREKFLTWPQKKFDRQLFTRLLKFGMPNATQFFLDILAFNVFVQLLSDMGKDISMAGTVAFSMNAIAFIPMTGIGMTASIFVGQAVGSGKIELARRAVRSCCLITLVYMGIMGGLFAFQPDLFCRLFPLKGVEHPEAILELSRIMMRYIAAYLLFDGIFIVYCSAIKGAGDTFFSMWIGVLMAWLLFAIPSFVAWKFFHSSPWTLWTIMVIYVMIASIVFYLRYRHGKWQHMRVIESKG